MAPLAQTQTVVVTFNPAVLFYWVAIGLMVGFLMGMIIRRRAFGMMIGLVLGLIGSVVGASLSNLLDITILIHGTVVPGAVRDFLAAFLGAVLLLLIESTLFGYRHYNRYNNY